MSRPARPGCRANVERLHRFMDEAGLAALIVRSGVNYTYLSGTAYAGTLARHLDLAESPRPVYVVWPRDAAPALIVNPLAEATSRRDSWISDVRVYPSYTGQPLDRLREVLVERGVTKGRIGCEQHYFGAAERAALGAAFPGMELVDATSLLERVRQIKTPAELVLLKEAAHLLDEAFLEVYARIEPGETECSVHSRLVGACLRRGATFAHGWLACSRNTVPAGGQSSERFRAGDVVRTDYVAYLAGYPGHASRNAVLGQPSVQQLDAHRRVREVYLGAIERCRPGVATGEIYRFVADRFGAAGLRFAGQLVGHGVDCWWHQQEPIFARDSTARLEENMVVALEPGVDEWITQDMFVITADGAQLLSDRFPTAELHIIPV